MQLDLDEFRSVRAHGRVPSNCHVAGANRGSNLSMLRGFTIDYLIEEESIMRIILHYIFAASMLTVYGGQV
jgi:hypothetical protein